MSYHWESGGRYGVNLAQRLVEAKYDVFLDRAEYAMGDDWKKVGEEALANTQRLVLVATRKAVTESKPVEREVNLFTRRKRQIIPIVFEDHFEDLDWGENKVLSRMEEAKLRINEKAKNLERGPSDEIIQNLVRTHGIMRRRTLRICLIVNTISLLTIGAIFAEWQREIAVEQRTIAEEKEREALHQLGETHWNNAIDERQNEHPLKAAHYFALASQAFSRIETPETAAYAVFANLALTYILVPPFRLQAVLGHEGHYAGTEAIMSRSSGRILTWNDDGMMWLLGSKGGEVLTLKHDGDVKGGGVQCRRKPDSNLEL